MPRKKTEYERIQLLATPDISEWWSNLKEDSDRQEKLRECVRKGIALEKGDLVTVSTEQLKVYQAMETLYKSGIMPVPEKAAPPPVVESEQIKPKINRLKSSIEANKK
ncbi:hypothetical protein [Brevibacillus centrosporus]|uniref:hypothetical protein n=1 Tax=Brevibacillus centrosporus TaxID=54910 RepID=UPI002E1DF82F|nr:hypothetical protein [Brevibacillus centrosporus]